jgi:lipopolysaccharide export system protein LptC
MRQSATIEIGDGRRARRPLPAHRRYSRMIELLRYLLPAVALSLIALVALWPQLIGSAGGLIVPIFANAKIEGADLMLMHNPRYLGRTDKDEPYEVTADSAYADPKRPNLVNLDHPAGALTSAGPRDVKLTSDSGLYNRTADKLDLKGSVELTTSDGYRFDTERAHIDLQAGQVVGDQPIQGSGPTGTLAADRFEIRDKGDLLHFEGRVKVVLPPHPSRERAP